MKTLTLHELFLEELEDIFSGSHQLEKALPKLLKLSSASELQKNLSNLLIQTQTQVMRLENVFAMLDVNPKVKSCDGMKGLLEEAFSLAKNHAKSIGLDAALICVLQKIQHYEMATYSSIRNFANHLDQNNELIDLIQESLDEVSDANRKLTKLAEGSIFKEGINSQAVITPKPKRSSKVL